MPAFAGMMDEYWTPICAELCLAPMGVDGAGKDLDSRLRIAGMTLRRYTRHSWSVMAPMRHGVGDQRQKSR